MSFFAGENHYAVFFGIIIINIAVRSGVACANISSFCIYFSAGGNARKHSAALLVIFGVQQTLQTNEIIRYVFAERVRRNKIFFANGPAIVRMKNIMLDYIRIVFRDKFGSGKRPAALFKQIQSILVFVKIPIKQFIVEKIVLSKRNGRIIAGINADFTVIGIEIVRIVVCVYYGVKKQRVFFFEHFGRVVNKIFVDFFRSVHIVDVLQFCYILVFYVVKRPPTYRGRIVADAQSLPLRTNIARLQRAYTRNYVVDSSACLSIIRACNAAEYNNRRKQNDKYLP